MTKKHFIMTVISIVIFFLMSCATAKTAELETGAYAEMYVLDLDGEGGKGELAGRVSLAITEAGLELGLEFGIVLADGQHGFHIHEGKSLAGAKNRDGKLIAGLAAKGHYDPMGSGKHEGPNGDGHLGDLPILGVIDGKAVDEKLLASRIKSLADLYGRVLMIHVAGDNYSDEPMALGGGGARYIAGIITAE